MLGHRPSPRVRGRHAGEDKARNGPVFRCLRRCAQERQGAAAHGFRGLVPGTKAGSPCAALLTHCGSRHVRGADFRNGNVLDMAELATILLAALMSVLIMPDL